MIPAIEEQKQFFNKKLEIARGFGYSLEKLSKEIGVHRTTIYEYIGARKVEMKTYLELNKRLEEFIIGHLESKKGFHTQKIEEIEELQTRFLKIKNIY